MTWLAGGASRTMALLMPVRCSMKEGMRRPAFIKLWY
jgi:hypothetical protein